MNKLTQIQEILFYEIQKLNSDNIDLEEELKRSNAITKGATSFIKSVDTQLKIIDMSMNYGIKKENLLIDTGVKENEEKY